MEGVAFEKPCILPKTVEYRGNLQTGTDFPKLQGSKEITYSNLNNFDILYNPVF